MASAADVPNRYDLFISDGTNSQGFVLLDAFRSDANVPEKAIHSFSPTFVPRTNVEGNYGDDSQEFFLTFSQNDWSLGEQKKYQGRGNDPTRRYWIGTNVDVATPGQVSLRASVRSIDVGLQNVLALASRQTTIMAGAETNLYEVSADGTVTDRGAHGLAAQPTAYGLACDAADTYITDGSTIRKWDGSAFASFSASGATAIVYLNNALYGTAAGNLYRWSTAGARTTIHTWQDVDGTAINTQQLGAIPTVFGGKLLITIPSVGGVPSSTWIYDGVGVSKLFDFPSNFNIRSVTVSNGTVFYGGFFNEGAFNLFPAVYYYSNGSTGLLWKSLVSGTEPGALVTSFDDGIVVADFAALKYMQYTSGTGGLHSVGAFTNPGVTSACRFASCQTFSLLSQVDDILFAYPHNASVVTTGTVTSSLFDFDSSLEKFFRGIKVDYDEAIDGDGGSADIAYRINDLTSTYTTLQVGAVSGTEYTLGSVGAEIAGRSISVRITLNKGTSTLGPVLKRIYVRAAPRVNSFHRSKATLNLAGRNGDDHVMLRDESLEPLDGLELAHKLKDFTQVDGLLNITDKFGTRVSTIESLEMVEVRPEEFVANLVFRQV